MEIIIIFVKIETSRLLLETPSGNLLLGFIPESLGLLIFGIVLIAFAAGLRRILDRTDRHRSVEEFERTARKD